MPNPPVPRPEVAAMHPYMPGEQPRDPLLIKLNTNENNYPPSPKVGEALRGLGDRRIGKYPDPVCGALRQQIADDLGVDLSQVWMGNGSDEVLKMAAEAYVSPGERVGYLWPTYSLYPIFVEKAGAEEVRFPWDARTPESMEQALANAPMDLKLAYLTSPNPPIGFAIPPATIRAFAEARPETLVIVDEAYIAYGGESAVGLVGDDLPNVAVTRTFSKSHSLAGLRVGFIVASRAVSDMIFRVKDSYNLNVVTQVAALAAWQDAEWTSEQVAKIVATRERVRTALIAAGFDVPPSAGNFLFARRDDAEAVFQGLRRAHVLVRWFNMPELADGIRISIGRDDEMDEFLSAVESLG